MRPLLRQPWLTRRIPLPRLPRTAPHIAIHHTSTSNAAPVEIPRLIVAPGSSYHNSLASYLEYASRRNLHPDRTVFIGTHYEYTVADSLLRLGFSLIRTGKKNDAGIDLIGHWMLSFFREPMPVFAQCKSRIQSCSPTEVRELEGAFQSLPPVWRNKDVLGLLITTQKATEGMRNQMLQSSRPLAFMQICRDGKVSQFLWNRAASEKGLEGVGVTPRYTVLPLESSADGEAKLNNTKQNANVVGVDGVQDSSTEFRKPATLKRPKVAASRPVVTDIQLTWLGTPISPNRDELASETARRISAIVRAQEEPKTGPGRPPKFDKGKKSTTVATKREPVKPPKAKAKIKASVAKSTAQKPRGRPPKTTAVTISNPRRGRPSKAEVEKAIAAPEKAKKPRGRPPNAIATTSIAKKPRGRPPKVITGTPSAKKSRGRPPKAIAVTPTTKRPRGRPPKAITITTTARKSRGRSPKATVPAVSKPRRGRPPGSKSSVPAKCLINQKTYGEATAKIIAPNG